MVVATAPGDGLKRDTFYWHIPHYQGEGSYPGSAIRVGNDKLIYNYHQQDFLLFDLANDPGEQHDRARQMPELAEQLDKQLMRCLDETGAVIPQPIAN
ncbi:hypothetical protein SAMN06265222_107194 [Neorhodopirellula lusitana]|uniref:N-sulphoglucosamine sulphohydrolase C-terminal domain-containing protein n=1 Tax=Neorhodopirellula lusitana TaxID=445327 RepID=A0ABY1Q7Q0_9BACT|nr:hypothetical protein [Neorhodopirellula lusitana]SMP61941.1 hypothetical protein SAMN06265222_107194 [Neorhodopirellula lusitana]